MMSPSERLSNRQTRYSRCPGPIAEGSALAFGESRFPHWVAWGIVLLTLTLPRGATAQSSEEHLVEKLSVSEVGPFRPEHSPDLPKTRQLIVQKTNEFRASEGRDELQRDQQLDATAQDFAEYMAKTDRYGHNADGRRPSQRAENHDYEYCLIAENIAYQFATESFKTNDLAERTVQGWIDSPGHRRNMLKKHVTEIGVGVAQSDKTGIFYAVQLFGRPRSAAITFTLENDAGQSIEYTLGNRTFALPPRYRRQHQICVPRKLKLASAGGDSVPEERSAVSLQDQARYRVTMQDGKAVLTRDAAATSAP